MKQRDIPCRVSADLAAYDRQQRDDAMNAPEFTYLEEDFRQIVTKELARPLELLFSTRDQVEAIRGSFGNESVDSKKAVDWLMADLHRLEEEILTLWENA